MRWIYIFELLSESVALEFRGVFGLVSPEIMDAR
jgi:hypothetical protein